jgi:serine/threonine protein kinase
MQTAKYEMIRKLAVGGMAELFLARVTGPMGFNKTLVLKRILPQLAGDPSFVEMFLREARLAAQLNHPHIVQIFDFGEAYGSYFLAMEYVDGPNLRVLLKTALAAGTPLPPTLCARLIASACEGLAFAHDFQDPATGRPLGLIHRDISPENILVSRQGAVKLVDFGIAKTADQSPKTQSGIVKGKLSYLSPEQVRSMPLDRRVDVYALGVVLYELLTGQKPFTGPSDASLVQAILFDPLPPTLRYRPDLPVELQRIVERALSRDREQRYRDCRAMQLDLEDFILSAGRSVGAYQVSQFIDQLFPSAAPMAFPARDTGERQALAAPARDSSRTVLAKTPTSSLSPAKSPPPPSVDPKRSNPPPFHPAQPGLPASASRPTASTRSLAWLRGLIGGALLMAGGGYITRARTSPEAPAASTAAVRSQPSPPGPAVGTAPGAPGTPSGTLTPRENPMPPSPGTSVRKPSTKAAEAKMLSQIEASGTTAGAR